MKSHSPAVDGKLNHIIGPAERVPLFYRNVVLLEHRALTRISCFNSTMHFHNQNYVKLMQNLDSAIILGEIRWLCRTCFTHILPTWHQQNTILQPFPLPTPSNKCSCANATETNSTDLQAAVNNPTPVRTARRQDIWQSLGFPCVDWEKQTGGRTLGEYCMGGQSTIQGPQTARVLQLGPIQTALQFVRLRPS